METLEEISWFVALSLGVCSQMYVSLGIPVASLRNRHVHWPLLKRIGSGFSYLMVGMNLTGFKFMTLMFKREISD